MEKKNENNSGIINDKMDSGNSEETKKENEIKKDSEAVAAKKQEETGKEVQEKKEPKLRTKEKPAAVEKPVEKEPPVVKEHIKPKYKKKLKRLLEVAVLAVVAGLVFGLVARFTFSSQVIGKLFGMEDEEKNEKPTPSLQRSAVTFPSATGTAQKKDSDTGKQTVSFADNMNNTPDGAKKDDGKTGYNPSGIETDNPQVSQSPSDITDSSVKQGNTGDSSLGESGQKSAVTGFEGADLSKQTVTPAANPGNDGGDKADSSASGKQEGKNVGGSEDGKDARDTADGKNTQPSEGDGNTSVFAGENDGSSGSGDGNDTSENPDMGSEGVPTGTEDGGETAALSGSENGDSSKDTEGADPSVENPDGENVTGQEGEDTSGDNQKPDEGGEGVITDIGTGEGNEEGSEKEKKDNGPDLFGADSLNSYKQVMDELHGVAKKAAYSLISINAVTTVANWMSESVETRETTTGIIVADNGVELLALTYYDKVKASDRLEIILTNGKVYEGSLLSFDTEYNMAVVAIPLNKLSDEDREYTKAVRFGNTAELYPGMPVIALGSPNGNPNSLEYGYITGVDQKMYLMDSVCSLFTTDITNNSASEGIVINLDGELIGVISRHTDASSQTGTSTEIYIDSLTPVALKLCNSMSRPYFGIRAEDIPDSALYDLQLENGIYVNEVASDSPAEKADIHKGDIITSINGESIYSVRQFSEILMNTGLGGELEVDIFRSGRKNEPSLKVFVRPQI